MGALLKALTVSSSHRAKKGDIWQSIKDQITDCIVPSDIESVQRDFDARRLDIPYAWDEPIADLLEKRLGEIAEEDIGQIVRDKYDFT